MLFAKAARYLIAAVESARCLIATPAVESARASDEDVTADSTATPAVKSVRVPAVTNADYTDTEDEHCWICYGDEPDKNGRQLMRGCCSCRGSSGCLHLSCAVENAQTRTRSYVERESVFSLDQETLSKIWNYCPTCEQRWTGATFASMGEECVDYIYQEFHEDTVLKILALGIKLFSYSHGGKSSEERVRAGDENLAAIEEFESTSPVQAIPDIHLQKSMAHMEIGNAFVHVQNDPICAIEHFEKSKEALLHMSNPDHVRVLQVDTFIARAKVDLPGMDKKAALATLLEHRNRLHAVIEAKFGGDHHITHWSGSELASTLIELEQYAEAEPLLETLHKSACRVHGPNHSRTKYIEEMLKYVANAMAVN